MPSQDRDLVKTKEVCFLVTLEGGYSSQKSVTKDGSAFQTRAPTTVTFYCVKILFYFQFSLDSVSL